MKRLVSTLLAGIIALSVAVPAFAADTAAAPFKDVDSQSVQGQAILKMYDKGYLAGYEDGTFRPDGYVTRAELVRIINQVFDFKLNDKLATTDFSDNANNSAWYYNDVRIAQQMGYISGFGDNSFRPKDNFTRQQACVVLSLLTNAPESDKEITITDPVAPWAEKYVKASVNSGLFTLEPNNTFRAAENITRGELCVALAGFVKEDSKGLESPLPDKESTTKSDETTTKADDNSTTTTKSSTIVSSGGGGGGSSKTTTTTTAATTTETTTEATTSASKDATKAQTTTKATTTTTTTTEATTEITTAAVEVDADLISSLKRTARNITRYVVPNCSTDAQKEVASDIADAMTTFVNDNSYDVEGAASAAMDKYHALSAEEKNELKNLIVGYCAMSDLVKLRDTFFPGMTYTP